MKTDHRCAVCGGVLGEPIYDSQGGRSLTSLARIIDVPTRVRCCGRCAHLQSEQIADVAGYYDSEYDILVDSEEEDQVYEMRDGAPVYRTAHQVECLRARIPLDRPIALLDYGCAKSSTIRTLVAGAPQVTPFLFDVSARYMPFWQAFADERHCAVNVTPPAWDGRFDVVTSFFSLEHIPDLHATLRHMVRLLRPGGMLYAIVPDVFGNVADLIVADHCNHFTAPSLRRLVADAGLALVELDDTAHRGAFLLRASKPVDGHPSGAPGDAGSAGDEELRATRDRATALADYWRSAAERVRAFERSIAPPRPLAIYGAGFYGAFIAAALEQPQRVVCHVDQNPFLQGGQFDGRPVVAPAALPTSVDALLVGLNPAHARRIVAAIPAFDGRPLDCFFL